MNFYLPDTSVVLRLYEPNNPISRIVEQCLAKLIRSKAEIVVVPQILIEFWTVATRPQNVNGLGFTTKETEEALENLQTVFRLLPENERIFDEWKTLVAQHKVSGKTAHDARIVAAMQVHKITHLLTLNADDFKRYTNVSAITPQEISGHTN